MLMSCSAYLPGFPMKFFFQPIFVDYAYSDSKWLALLPFVEISLNDRRIL
jgi:hypothetical protein